MPAVWTRKDLLSLEELSKEELLLLLDQARAFKEISLRPIKKVPALRGRTVALCFLEPSTRTRASFELAAKRLSADLLAFQGERARQYYRKAEETLPKVDARGMVAARIMAAIYLDLLKAIERAHYDVFSGRIRVGRSRQALLAALTWLRAAMKSPSF